MEAQIPNPTQAFALGGTWGTPSVYNTATTEWAYLINQTGQTLYTGDIVALDVTGTSCVLTTTSHLTNVIGCVNAPQDLNAYPAVEDVAGTSTANTFPVEVGSTAGTGIGGITQSGVQQPTADVPFVSQTIGYTNGSSNITSASAATTNPLVVGQFIYTVYNASTNANPQIFQITSVGGSAGSWTGVVTNAPFTTFAATFTGTTGSYTSYTGRDFVSPGPGWPTPALGWSNTSAFNPGVKVPIITRGFGWCNVDGNSSVAAQDGLGGTNNAVTSTRFAYASTGYASATGLIIAVAQEAYAGRNTNVRTALGITGHDCLRAIIGKM